MGCEQETFWTLLHDSAHWQFEIFLMVLFDGVIGMMLWPFVKKHWDHHIARDEKENGGWQPIETVPLNTQVMIYTSNHKKPIDTAFSPYALEKGKPITTIDGLDTVTHWMPLPEAPRWK